MAKKIYVENLPFDFTEERLQGIFSQIGEVQSVKIKTDFLTRHKKSSGIVEMSLDVDSYRAVNCFEGATFKNGKIHLKEDEPLIDKAKHVWTDLADSYERFSSGLGKEKGNP